VHEGVGGVAYRDTTSIKNSTPLGPYSRTMPRALWKPWGGGLFLMSEVPLYRLRAKSGPARAFYVRRDLYYRGTSPTRNCAPN
jgi:hypothetical protein